MGIRQIMHLDEISHVAIVHTSRQILKDSLCRQITSLVPIFMLEMHNQTNKKINVCPSSSKRIMRLKYNNCEDALSL